MWREKFPKTDWTSFLAQKGNPLLLLPVESMAVLRELLQECKKLLREGQIGKALDRMTLGCIIDKEYFLPRLKKEGLLRYSSYLNLRNPVAGIAKHFLKHHALFNLSEDEISYFESLQYLEKLFLEIKGVHDSITSTILRFKVRKTIRIDDLVAKTSIVKSLLAINDYAFLNREMKDRTIRSDFNNIEYSTEERSDAISFLISRADELIQIKTTDLLIIDEEFVKSQLSKDLIEQACRFKEYKEVEIFIESLGYICKKEGSIIQIAYKDDRTFRSMELSNIVAHRQKDTDSLSLEQQLRDFPSLKDLAALMHTEFPNLVMLKKTPNRRYRLELPEPLIEAIGSEEIGAFKEEYDALIYIQNELFLPLTEIRQYEIIKGLSLYDFMIFNRVFAVLQIIYSEKLKELSTSDNYLIVLNSILINFSEEKLLHFLTLVLPKEKVLLYLDVISWRAGKGEYLDLQYTPVIEKDRHYLVCLSVMIHSIMVRNVFTSLAKRNINPKAAQVRLLQLIPQQLKESFSTKGFICFTDLKVNYNGVGQTEGDIDFMCYRDGHLFIGECKDVTDSVDSFEYRRINDYLYKAASQLDYIKSALNDPKYLASLSDRMGIDLSNIEEVHYLIIPSARKMYGHSIGEYPVRNVHELIGFVRHGSVQYRLPGENLFNFRTWVKDEFEVTDLIIFCSSESLHNEFINAMEIHSYPLGKNFELMAYALNGGTALENLKAKYRYEESPFNEDI